MRAHFLDANGERRGMNGAFDEGASAAPMPLNRWQAIAQAAILARHGFDSPAIAHAMAYYHGWHLSPVAWRRAMLKWHGVTTVRPEVSEAKRRGQDARRSKPVCA